MSPEEHRRFLNELLEQLERIGEDLSLKARWLRDLPDTVPQPRRDELRRHQAVADRGTWLAEAARRARTEAHFRERSSGYEHECWLDDGTVIATLRVAHPAQGWLQVAVNPPRPSADGPVCPPTFWIRSDLNADEIRIEVARVAPWIASQILRVEDVYP